MIAGRQSSGPGQRF